MVELPSLFLIGPMGVGKTTIGKQLANTLHRVFIDSDKEIEKRTGAVIPLIFELEGEAGFRKREREALAELTQQSGIVLATGGGAVLHADNRAHLRERGRVIYLTAPLQQLLRRTARNSNRPLLKTENPEERMRLILEERRPLYEATAEITVDTGTRSVHAVVQEILHCLGYPAPSEPIIQPSDEF